MSTTEIIKHIFALPQSQQWKVVLGVRQKLQTENTGEDMSMPGESMSMEIFQQRISMAEKDIVDGRVFSTEEVRRRLNSWK